MDGEVVVPGHLGYKWRWLHCVITNIKQLSGELYMCCNEMIFPSGVARNRGLRDICALSVPANDSRLILPWKQEWRNRPIFQEIQGRRANTRTQAKIAISLALPVLELYFFLNRHLRSTIL